MLLIGMDVSGDEASTNYRFLSVVIGTDESILSLSNGMGRYSEHMARLEPAEKEDVISRLNFDKKNRIAFCVTLDRKRIVDEIIQSRKAKQRKISKGDILRTYNRVVMREILRRVESFVLSYGISPTDLKIQCDNDSLYFAKAVSLQHERKGAAYRISDYVAWCNNKDRTPDSVIEIDFTEEIPDRMKKILGIN